MMKKLFLVPVLCLALSILLSGCSRNNVGNVVSNAASKAGDAISKAGEDLSKVESRMESALDSDNFTSSRLPDDDFYGTEGSSALYDPDTVSDTSEFSSNLS